MDRKAKIKQGRSNKRKGATRERQVRDSLLAQGNLVAKAGGSLGAFDLIAVPMGDGKMYLRLVQVKSNCWPGPAERRVLEGLARSLTKTICPSVEMWRIDDGKAFRGRRWVDGNWQDMAATETMRVKKKSRAASAAGGET